MEAKRLFDQVNTYFGFKIPLISFDEFQRVLSAFIHFDVVCGFGVLDTTQTHLYNMTGVMIQAAILLKKKVYVYDEETEQWYVARLYRNNKKGKKGKTWHRFVPANQPTQSCFNLYEGSKIKPSTLAYMHQNSLRQARRVYH